jgi:hypothetical protein
MAWTAEPGKADSGGNFRSGLAGGEALFDLGSWFIGDAGPFAVGGLPYRSDQGLRVIEAKLGRPGADVIGNGVSSTDCFLSALYASAVLSQPRFLG